MMGDWAPLEVEEAPKEREEGGNHTVEERLESLNVRTDLEEALAEVDQLSVKLLLTLAADGVPVKDEPVEWILPIEEAMAGLKFELLKGKEFVRTTEAAPGLKERRDDPVARPTRKMRNHLPKFVKAEAVQDDQKVPVGAARDKVGCSSTPVEADSAEVIAIKAPKVGKNGVEGGVSGRRR